jgi:hypothetical protein
MSKENGRPKRAIGFEKQIKVLLTPAQYAEVLKKAKNENVSLSEFMRQRVYYGKIIPRFTPEELDLCRSLAALQGGLHQLVEEARIEGAGNLLEKFEPYRIKIEEAITEFNQKQKVQ